MCVSIRPILRSCQGHHKSPLVCATLTQFTRLFDLTKICKFVCLSVPFQGHAKGNTNHSQFAWTLTQFTVLFDDLDRNWKLCVSVRPISRSCQDHQKSPLVCLTFTQFAKHFDYLPKLPVLCDDIDKNLKMCVYPSHFNVMSGSSQITFTCVTMTPFTDHFH